MQTGSIACLSVEELIKQLELLLVDKVELVLQAPVVQANFLVC